MALEFLRQYLDQILIGAGTSVAGLVALVVGWKKFAKPTPKGARKRIKYLVKFINNSNVDGNLKNNVRVWTLEQIVDIANNVDFKWETEK